MLQVITCIRLHVTGYTYYKYINHYATCCILHVTGYLLQVVTGYMLQGVTGYILQGVTCIRLHVTGYTYH